MDAKFSIKTKTMTVQNLFRYSLPPPVQPLGLKDLSVLFGPLCCEVSVKTQLTAP